MYLIKLVKFSFFLLLPVIWLILVNKDYHKVQAMHTWLWPRRRNQRILRCPASRCRLCRISSAVSRLSRPESCTADSEVCATLRPAWWIRSCYGHILWTWVPAEPSYQQWRRVITTIIPRTGLWHRQMSRAYDVEGHTKDGCKIFEHTLANESLMLLLARLMGQYCFARRHLSASVVCRRL